MSERLVFELQAIDRATAPLKAVQTQLDNTTAATRRFGGQTTGTMKDFRKFTMGALQQAGFQIGDYAVQVANGTSKMQAFGQQAPQMLQIFGPIGSLVGAAVAVFAALAVAVEKSGSALSMLSNAIGDISKQSADLALKMEMIRFGVDTEAEAIAIRSILDLTGKIAEKNREIDALNGRRSVALDGELLTLQKQRIEAEMALGVLRQRREALSTAMTINQRMLAIENSHYQVAAIAERERIAKGKAIYEQMIAIQSAQAEYIKSQESFNKRLMEGYGLYGALRRQAQALSADAAAAAAAAQAAAVGAGRGLGRQGPELDPYGFRAQLERDRAAADRDSDTASGGGGATDAMKTLREQLALETELLGKTEAQQRVIQALGLDYQKYGDTALNGLVEQITKMDQLNKLAEQQKEIASTIRSAFSGAFMSMVDGTKSVKDAFKDMARSIILKLYEIYVVEQLVNSITGAFAKSFPSAGKALGFMANGGTMQANRPYIVGERGPELMVPGRSSAIIPNDKLGSGGGIVVNQTINISTGVQQTVRSEIRSLMPQIAESAKAAVFDAQRRSVNGMGFA